MMMPNILTQEESLFPIRDKDGIRDIVVNAVPSDRYVFCGEVSKLIEDKLGIFIAPDRVRAIAWNEKSIKRMWTPQGWTMTRSMTLSDYFSK